MPADVNVTEKVARAEAERRYASPAHYGRAEIQAFIAGALWHRARGADFGPAPVVPDGGHVLTEYGTTSCPVEIVRAEVVDGKCSACGAVVPDSPDVRERVRRAVKRAATWTEDGPEYEEAPDAGMVEAITDAVLAVVGQGMTAEQAWDEGYAAGLRDAPRGEPGGTPNPRRAAVRPAGQEQADG